MKKYIIGFVSILLLASACNKVGLVPYPDGPPTENPSQQIGVYNSPQDYGFSIKYPSEFGFDTNIEHVRNLAYIPVCDENMRACVFMGSDKFPGTNFDGAGVSVNIYANSTIKDCYDFDAPGNAAKTQVPDVTINNAIFKSATGTEGAAGHLETLQLYRNFHNNMCYEISIHVGETNIGVYEPGTVKEFNKTEVLQELHEVVNSFSFTK